MAGFTVRDYKDYATAMAAWVTSNPLLAPGYAASDLIEGSLERAHLEALAVIMEDYDVRAQAAIDYAVNNSVFVAFGFDYLPAQAAAGYVVFSALVAPSSAITIPAGTKLGTSAGIQFITLATATIGAGAFDSSAGGSTPIQAVVPGVTGNVPAGAVNRILYSVLGVDQVVNASPTIAGADVETDAARRTRFRSWVNTLVRGTKEALQFAAVSVANIGVVDALAIEPFVMTGSSVGAGNVWLYLDDGSGNPSVSGAVQTAVSQVLQGYRTPGGAYAPGWKAAGIIVTLKPVPYFWVYTKAIVTVASTGKGRLADIQTALTSAATTFFNGVTIGQPVPFSSLLAALTLCDPDIQAVQLQTGVVNPTISTTAPTWGPSGGVDSSVTPTIVAGASFSLNANDLAQAGARYTLLQGVGVDGVTYPAWTLQ